MTNADIAATLERLGIAFARTRPDLPIAGSPERCLERLAAESDDGRVWIVEKHEPRMSARKQEIAEAASFLAARLPEVKPWLAFAPGRFIAERADGAWQVSPFVPGDPLDRPAYAFEGWRGEALADLLIRFRSAAADMPGRGARGPLFAGRVRPRPLRQDPGPPPPALRAALPGPASPGARPLPQAGPRPGELLPRRFPSAERHLVPVRHQRPDRPGILRLPAGDL